MKFTLVLLFAFAANKISAQSYPEFAPIGAVWKWHATATFGPGGGGGTSNVYMVITSVGFDTIDGKPCKKLVFSTPFSYTKYAYRDGLKIFMYKEAFNPGEVSQWVLLYDFEKSAGESYFAGVPYPHYAGVDSVLVNVVATGDTTINGFSLPYMITTGGMGMNGLTLLNIGSDRYLIPWDTSIDPFYELHDFSCYYDPIFGHYYYDDSCSVAPTSVEEIGLKKFEVLVSPVPATKSVSVTNLHNAESILLRNVLGQQVFSQRLGGNTSEFTIDVHDLVDGIYFLTISDKNNVMYQTKIIKSE